MAAHRANRTLTRWVYVLAAVALVVLLATPVFAQPAGNVPFRAYLTAEAGWGRLAENIYDNFIDDSYYRAGGGFGVEYGKYNAEVLYRTGTESWLAGMAITGYRGPLAPDGGPFRTREIQVKVGVSPWSGRFRAPAGVLASYTTFSSETLLNAAYPVERSGWTIGTFVGAELSVTRWLAFGVEMQYDVGLRTGGPGPADFYYNQSRVTEPLRDAPFSAVPPGMSYFDSVGFFNTRTDGGSSRGGYLIQVRTVIYLPEFGSGKP